MESQKQAPMEPKVKSCVLCAESTQNSDGSWNLRAAADGLRLEKPPTCEAPLVVRADLYLELFARYYKAEDELIVTVIPPGGRPSQIHVGHLAFPGGLLDTVVFQSQTTLRLVKGGEVRIEISWGDRPLGAFPFMVSPVESMKRFESATVYSAKKPSECWLEQNAVT